MHELFKAITFIKKCEQQLWVNYCNADEKQVTITLVSAHCDPYAENGILNFDHWILVRSTIGGGNRGQGEPWPPLNLKSLIGM